MNGYAYQCVVSGTCAPQATSGCGLLTVNTPIAITSQPAASTICAGNSTSFSATATGSGLGYQWQVSLTGCAGTFTNLANGAPYSGVNTATLTINPTTAAAKP